MRLTSNARSVMIDALVDLADAGSGPGTVQIRDGSLPATPGDSGGTLLVTLTLNDPGFASAVTGVVSADVATAVTGTAVASGTPTWYRVLDSDGTAVWDGTTSADMTINPSTITNGATVSLVSWTLTQPAS
jgi:hypothetical protein